MNATLTAPSPATHAAGEGSTPSLNRWMRWPLLRCLALYRQTPWRFGLTLLLYAAINVGLALQQWLLGRAVNEVQLGQGVLVKANGDLDIRPVLLSLALLAGVAFGRAVLQYTAAIVGLVIQQRLLSTLRESIFQQVQTLHLAYHWQHGAGEMITRTTRDADKVRDALTSFWRQGVDSCFVVMASMGYLFWYHTSLGIVPLLLTLLAFFLLLHQADALVELDRVVGEAYDQVNQDLTEGVHGVRVIKSFTLEADRVKRFRAQVQHFVSLGETALAYASIRIPLPQMLVGFGQVWVLGWGMHLVAQGRLNSGELVAALLMVNLLVLRIEGIGRVIKVYADARSSAARIWDLLDARSPIIGGTEAFPIGQVGVRLTGVRVFPPGGGRPVLEDVSLEIARGEIVGLVGATGSGKSTLASLFPRLLDPDEGEILIESHGAWLDSRLFDLTTLRKRVQVVPQECFLFSDSLADNLRLASPDATDAELFDALRIACADDFVRSLPDGLSSKFGDRGVTLSGGQRQRLCIARALLARPAILVLDDATSALDSLTERGILDHMRSATTQGVYAPAVLMISNRRASLALADRVLLLEGGRIKASGTQSELSKCNASYRALMGIPADGH